MGEGARHARARRSCLSTTPVLTATSTLNFSTLACRWIDARAGRDRTATHRHDDPLGVDAIGEISFCLFVFCLMIGSTAHPAP